MRHGSSRGEEGRYGKAEVERVAGFGIPWKVWSREGREVGRVGMKERDCFQCSRDSVGHQPPPR